MKKSGFTLVELIVVIAILAILAGIAVPVYSGYIQKAHQAADNELLAAVNTSFAAACAEAGLGSTDVTGAMLRVTDRCITGVTVTGVSSTANLAARPDAGGIVYASLGASFGLLDAASAKAAIQTAFPVYFGDNATVKLSYYDGAGNFVFNKAKGVFEAYANGEDIPFTFSYTDADGNTVTTTLSISTDDLNDYFSSGFADVGAKKLMDEVNNVVSGVANIGGGVADKIASLFTDGELEALGISKDDDNYTTELANALVLRVAELTANGEIDADELVDTLLNSAYGSFMPEEEYIALTSYYDEYGTLPEGVTLPDGYANVDDWLEDSDYWEAYLAGLQGGNHLGLFGVIYGTEAVDNGDGTMTINSYTYDEDATVAAALYGVITAYANSNTNKQVTYYDKTLKENVTSTVGEVYRNMTETVGNFSNTGGTAALTSMLSDMERLVYTETYNDEGTRTKQVMNSDFKAYLNSDAAKTDLNAYISAMNMINANAEEIGKASLVSSGFGDTNLQSMIVSVLG